MASWIDQLCLAARNHGASDLYLLENELPQFRLNGVWTPVTEDVMPADEMDVFWTNCGGTSATRDMDCSYVEQESGRFRVNLFRSLGRRGAVLRHIKTTAPTFAELGAPEALLSRWIERKAGIVLITGRTGAGKSTTLAACLQWINERSPRHIITIEDPIEFLFEPKQSLFSQREVGLDTSSFAEGLRRALRQSPDVIMVGEIRDADSARTALQAAETGHLVLASVHSQNVPETIERLAQLFTTEERGGAMHLLAAEIIGIVSQQLIPSKRGLTLVCEYMENGSLARKWIKEAKYAELADLISKGDRREMQSFLPALVEKCKAGEIEEEEAAGVSRNPQEFIRLLRGISAGATSRR